MTDDTHPKPDFIPYDAAKAIALVKAVFPRSTAELLQQSTGVPMRQVTRWLNGDSRIPPKLLGKLERQGDLRRQLTDEIRNLYEEMRVDGLTRQAARSAILELAASGEFDQIDEI
ncbi:hypothetical protein [Jiella pelagia]|uniref:Homeodomain-like domain-containing protein n=1 Tax=Jiella pelagia TaxID=2986949 RepID=A0ABY7C052_9HYPH|nr:hypothetical protein [Jiella pelagia]WAP69117.1 hypothetical protein OH818_01950 [Jiella pelagia]